MIGLLAVATLLVVIVYSRLRWWLFCRALVRLSIAAQAAAEALRELSSACTAAAIVAARKPVGWPDATR